MAEPAHIQTTENNTALATIAPPRLQYPKGLEERFGVDRTQWKALVEAVFPAAKTPDSVVLALSYCKARKLDPFKRVVHIVPVWDSGRGAMVETVWPGIAEHRVTAFRTKQYGGADAAVFGPTIERKFSGETKKGAVNITVSFPEWCQVTVYRMIDGQRAPIPGPRVYWLETFSRLGKAEVPNDMWQKRPFGQIEKCAEAAALRRAFPEELGGELTVDEVGAVEQATFKDVTPDVPVPGSPADLDAALAAESAPQMVEAEAVNVDDLRVSARPWFKKFETAKTQDAVNDLLADPDWVALAAKLTEHDPDTLAKIAKHHTKETK